MSDFNPTPHDPQHPPDLLSQPPPDPQASGDPNAAFAPHYPPYGPPYETYSEVHRGANQYAPHIGFVLPPEIDPPVNASDLTRKVANKLQRDTAKWAKQTRYDITPDEGKPFMLPLRNFGIGLVAGSALMRSMISTFADKVPVLWKSRPWLLSVLLAGYPMATGGLYLALLPASKMLLEQKSPIGAQARYFYRLYEAEAEGKPPPIPPFPYGPPRNPHSGWATGHVGYMPQQMEWKPMEDYRPLPYAPPGQSRLAAQAYYSESHHPGHGDRLTWDQVRKSREQQPEHPPERPLD